MSHEPYTPIDCGLHDELQLLALRRLTVELVVDDGAGAPTSLRATPVDVSTRDGAEWLDFEDGTSVRLDRLVEVDGRRFRATC